MFKTIQGKYTLYIIVTVTLFLLFLLGINYTLMRSHSLTTAQDTSEMLLDHADKQLDLVFSDIEAVVRSIASQRSVQQVETDRMKQLFLENVKERQEFVRAIYLGTAEGQMYEWGVGEGFIDNVPSFPEGYDPRTRPWYITGKESASYALSDPYIYASIPSLGITAVMPVYEGSRFIGVLGLDLIIDGLQNLVDSLKIEKGGRLIVLNNAQQVLVNQFEAHPYMSQKLERYEIPELLEADETPVVIRAYGSRYLVARTTNEATGWGLLLFVPYDDIIAFSQENVKIILFFDVLLMVLLGAIVTYISRRLVTYPLEDIISVMRRREQGELSARIPQEQSSAEFRLTARLFNRLSDMAQDSSKKMEEEVTKRTEDVLRLQKENMRLRIIEEKERLYANMHDALGARLTGINISNNVAKQALQRSEYEVTSQMHERIEKNTQQAISDLKEILLSNESDLMTADDLMIFIEEILPERLSVDHIVYNCDPVDDWMLRELSSTRIKGIQRILQELVTNTLKHAHARHVKLSCSYKNDQLSLLYNDDGKGFDLRKAYSRGFGLQGIHTRLERLGGVGKFTTKPGKGVSFLMRFPLERRL